MPVQDASIVDDLRRALQDAQELVRSEVALAKAELRQELTRVGKGLMALAAAAVLALMALAFFLTALAWGLSAWFGWPVWAGFGVVTVLAAGVAALLAYAGRRRVTTGPHMPLTVDLLKENVQWMRRRAS